MQCFVPHVYAITFYDYLPQRADTLVHHNNDFPDQTIMAQSGNGAACESDLTSLGTGQELNFDDDTLKGKDSYNVNSESPKGF